MVIHYLVNLWHIIYSLHCCGLAGRGVYCSVSKQQGSVTLGYTVPTGVVTLHKFARDSGHKADDDFSSSQ